MKHYKTLALSTVATLGLLMSSASVYAEGARFTSHHLVAQEDYAAHARQLDDSGKLELRNYLNYEEREPCQNYKHPPKTFIDDGCSLDFRRKQPEKQVIATTVETNRMELRPIISDYTVYFDFDKSGIRASEQSTLDTVARDIKKFEPYEVTIVGHTDRAGSNAYNVGLSQKRAQAVSNALHAQGIPNRILDEKAKGESDPAVQTNDGVKLQENRRVEIQFRK